MAEMKDPAPSGRWNWNPVLFIMSDGVHGTPHATGPDASVLIVENADVSPENSDHIPVNVGWLFRREEEK